MRQARIEKITLNFFSRPRPEKLGMRSGRAPPPSPNPAGIAVTRCSSGNFVSLPRRGGREIGAPDVTRTYRIISGIGVRARLIRGLEALHPRQSTASIHREGATQAKANSTPLLGFPGARPLVRESERSESAPPGGRNRTTPPVHRRASCRKIGRPKAPSPAGRGARPRDVGGGEAPGLRHDPTQRHDRLSDFSRFRLKPP